MILNMMKGFHGFQDDAEDSGGVHQLLLLVYLLGGKEKKYPLTQEMLSRMLSGRLEVNHECEMAFKLLRFIKSQYKKHLIAVEVTAANMEVTTAGYVSTAGKDCRKYSKTLLLLEKWVEAEEDGDPNEVQAVSFYPKIKPFEPLEWKSPKNQLKPSSIEPPKLELKELPEHLEYAFIQENNQLLVAISSALSTIKKARLLDVLKNHKGAIA
ncbi:hypothetical protein Tco_0563260 [Tanacetum coccineum]